MKGDSSLTKAQLLEELQKVRGENSALKNTYKLFLDGPVVVFHWVNSEGWPVDYVSSNVSSLLGYSSEDFCSGKISYANLIVDSDMQQVTAEVECFIKTGRDKFDHQPYRVLHKDGTLRWLHDHTIAIKNESNEVTHFYGYVFDISESEEAKRIKSHFDSISRGIINNTPLAIYVKDLDGKFLLFNNKFKSLFNVTQQDVGKTNYDLFSNDLAQQSNKQDAWVIDNNSSWEFEELIPHNDEIHTYLTVKFPLWDENGNVLAIGGVLTDITQQKELEEWSIINNNQHETAQKLAKLGHWRLDLTSNKLDWSDEIYHIFELDKKGFTPSYESFVDAIHPQDREALINAFNEAIINNLPYDFVHRLQMKDGRIKYVHGKSETTYDENGNACCSTGTVQDITLYKESERSLLKACNSLGLSIAERDNNLSNLSAQVAEAVSRQMQAEEKLSHRADILKTISNLSKVFLSCKDWQNIIARVLKEMGEVTGVSRTYLFKNTFDLEDVRFSLLYEWCAEGIEPQCNNPDIIDGSWSDIGFLQYYEKLNNGYSVTLYESEYTQAEKDILDPQNVKSLIMVPLKVQGVFWGVIGFDNCIDEYLWTDLEIDSLKTIAGIISAAISNQQSDRSIKQREQIINSIYLASPTGIGLVKNRVFAEVNDTFCKMTGYLEAELLGQSSRMVYWNQEDYEKVGRDKYDQIKKTGSGIVETQFKTKSGKVKNILLSSVLVNKDDWGSGAIFSALDITERKKIEQELENERLYFTSLLKNIPDIICFKDSEGHWLEANDSLLKLFHLEGLAYKGKTNQEIMESSHGKNCDALEVCTSFDELAIKKGKAVEFELTLENIDNLKVTFAMTKLPIYKLSGEVEALLVIGHDITNQKLEEVKKLHDLAKQKDTLVREVHHRIKNHLQGIVSLIKQSKKNQFEDDDLLTGIISKIHSISIVYGLQAEGTGMNILFGNMLDAITRNVLAMSMIPLVQTYEENSLICNVSKEKAVSISLIINELLMNALKYFRPINEASNIHTYYSHEDDGILFMVSNSGVLPENFNFEEGKGCGVGLELIKAMLPSKGLILSITQEGDLVMAKLLITAPYYLKNEEPLNVE